MEEKREPSELNLLSGGDVSDRKVAHSPGKIALWCWTAGKSRSLLTPGRKTELRCHKTLVLVLTFCSYTTFHLTRKPFSAVKGVLKSCNLNESYNTCCPGWAPFNQDHGTAILGSIDYSFLFAYAVSMYISGLVADRVNLRYFLVIGMIGSGLGSVLIGVAYFANIHALYYFILVQLAAGAIQSTGWPAVVAILGHWFGKERRGLIMGIWNSNIPVGNILGTVIPAIWATCDGPWGWSFVVPGFIIIGVSVPVFLLLVIAPNDVGLPSPVHYDVLDYTELKEENMELKSIGNAPKTVAEPKPAKGQAISICRAVLIPGVIEYSLALFFTKLVGYTFLFWLPLYIYRSNDGFIGGMRISNQFSDWLSTFFDVGGLFGTILCGAVSDIIDTRAVIIAVFLYTSVPLLFLYRTYGAVSHWCHSRAANCYRSFCEWTFWNHNHSCGQ
eukprot:Em0006g881a